MALLWSWLSFPQTLYADNTCLELAQGHKQLFSNFVLQIWSMTANVRLYHASWGPHLKASFAFLIVLPLCNKKSPSSSTS